MTTETKKDWVEDGDDNPTFSMRLPLVSRTARVWRQRYDRLIEDGFSVDESTWAADNRVRLGNPKIVLIRKARRLYVSDYLKAFPGSTREDAIESAAKTTRGKARRDGLRGPNIHNIFKEISP